MKALEKNSIRTILVRATNWLGDAVMNTPAMGVLREAFPVARITVLATPLVAELFSPHDAVDEVIVYDKKGIHAGLAGKLRLAAELRSRGFDLAVLFQDAFDAALITWLARIPRRMGNKSDGRGLLLTHGFNHKKDPTDHHHVDNYLRMLGHFGIAGSTRALALTTTAEEDTAMAQFLDAEGISSTDFLIGINPGATFGSAKRWYPERFAAVAARLCAEWGAEIVVTGGPDETGMANEITSALGGRCLNMAGQTTVRQLMALIKRCNFFITNDSGPMHIAAAFQVPTVAVFGSTDHRTTHPFSNNSIVVRKDIDCAPCLQRECPSDHLCMTAISVDDVVEAARVLYSKHLS